VKFIAPFSGLEAGPWAPPITRSRTSPCCARFPGSPSCRRPIPPRATARSAPRRRSTARCTSAFGFLRAIEGYDAPFTPGEIVTVRDGGDAAILATGSTVQTALTAHARLAETGIAARGC
jgi:hypothetical protein